MSGSVDLIYDRIVAEEKLKAGTKYERLAAIVFSILTENHTVHDLRLRGAVGVPHQIDAVVGDARRRIIIEAKDYGRNVTLPVVRDFSAVVSDLQPDEAFVVTTVGFSRNAVTWANAHGIKLAILRAPEEAADWGNLLQSIHTRLEFSAPTDPKVEWLVPPDEGHRFANGRNPIGRRPLDDLRVGPLDTPSSLRGFIEPLLEAEQAKIPAGKSGEMSGSYDFDGPTWLHVPGTEPIRVNGLRWTQQMVAGVHEFTTGFGFGGLTAELMLRTVDGQTHRIFSNHQIEAVNFDGKTARPPQAVDE